MMVQLSTPYTDPERHVKAECVCVVCVSAGMRRREFRWNFCRCSTYAWKFRSAG